MANEIQWFSSMAERRVTVTEIGEILGVSRRTATNRLDAGLSSDDLIAVSRALNVPAISALVELGKITHDEAFEYVNGDGQLLATARAEQVVFRLAEEMLTPAQKIELGGAARHYVEQMDNVRHLSVADSSPDEDALRAQQEEGEFD